ncbi:MAG: phage baseplate assembly protein [Pseudomonadota bacterium]
MNMDALRKALLPIRSRLATVLLRAAGHLVDASGPIQRVQVEAYKGEVRDRVEHVEGYGRTAVPPDGWEGILGALGANRDHTVCLAAVHRASRPQGAAKGDNVIYDVRGNLIWLKGDKLYIKAVNALVAEAPTCTITSTTTHIGDATINGALTVNGPIHSTGNITSDADIADATGSMGDMRDVHNIHDHYVPTAPGTSNASNQQM